MRLTLPIIGFSLLCIAVSSPAYGYIDPGTGSLIIQSLIGAIAAIGVTLKIYWHKIKLFFSRHSSAANTDEQDESTEQ